MRKHRPHESHPSSSCRFCGHIRFAKRLERRRERYAKRAILAEEMAFS